MTQLCVEIVVADTPCVRKMSTELRRWIEFQNEIPNSQFFA